MEINLTLTGEPRSTSHIYKMTCRGKFASMYMSKDGKDIKSHYQKEARSQFNFEPMSENLKVMYTLYFGTKRKSDVDNFNKLIGDALTGIVWVDDNQIQELTIRKNYDKTNPRVELSIMKHNE